MEKYRYSDQEQSTLEHLRQPFAVYQFIDKRVVTLVLSDGFCRLFGYNSRAEAYREMDGHMCVNCHPDDAARIADAALHFEAGVGQCDVIYRAKLNGSSDYRIIHAYGEHVETDTGARLMHVWYVDEGVNGEDAGLIRKLEEAQKIQEFNQTITSLLDNMPGMTFTKDAKTGVYLACNQAFAAYAHKATPAGVAGLTDAEIFDAETAAHFVEDDQHALSMD